MNTRLHYQHILIHSYHMFIKVSAAKCFTLIQILRATDIFQEHFGTGFLPVQMFGHNQCHCLSVLMYSSTAFQSTDNHFPTITIPHLEQLFKLSERRVTCSALSSIFKSLNKKVKKL